MDEKSYKVDEMVSSMVDLASEEVRKAKQRGYFGKDLAEAVCYVVKMANGGEMGRYNGEYGEYGASGEFGRRDRDGEYGHYTEEGEYEARRGQRYGRNGQRYG